MAINYDSITLQETLIPKCQNHLVGNFDVHLHAKNHFDPLSSFLRYCKDIANLLFWGLLECWTTPIKSHNINLQETFMFICMQKINFIPHFFLKILQRNSKIVPLGNLNMIGHILLKRPYQFGENFDIYLQAKKKFILQVFLEILQK